MKSVFFVLLSTLCIVLKAQCDVSRKVDKFTGEVKLSTPYHHGKYYELNKIIYHKVISGLDTTCYMSLRTGGPSLKVSQVGVIILLSNGDRISLPDEKIDCDPGYGGYWEYSVFLRLDKELIKKLSESEITDFRLYIYDATFNEKERHRYNKYLKCILSS